MVGSRETNSREPREIEKQTKNLEKPAENRKNKFTRCKIFCFLGIFFPRKRQNVFLGIFDSVGGTQIF